jgi:CHAD domain-containing protein
MAFVVRLVPHAPATDRPDAGRTGADTGRAALADGVSRLLSNEGGVRAGDVEALHQMRVAVRRLRSDLRTLRPLLERAWADGLSDAMRPLAASLGAVRDLDVLVERLDGHGADLEADLRPLTGGLRELRDIGRAALIESLTSPDHAVLVARIVAAAREPRLAPTADVAAADVVPTIVTAAWRKLARRGDPLARALAHDLHRPTDAQLHRVRILAKRARYASEAASATLGRRRGRDAARFAKRLAEVQQLLGDHQDATGLIRELRDAVAMRPANTALAFAAGRLMERELATTARDRAAFPGLWAQLRRPKLRRWLDR